MGIKLNNSLNDIKNSNIYIGDSKNNQISDADFLYFLVNRYQTRKNIKNFILQDQENKYLIKYNASQDISDDIISWIEKFCDHINLDFIIFDFCEDDSDNINIENIFINAINDFSSENYKAFEHTKKIIQNNKVNKLNLLDIINNILPNNNSNILKNIQLDLSYFKKIVIVLNINIPNIYRKINHLFEQENIKLIIITSNPRNFTKIKNYEFLNKLEKENIQKYLLSINLDIKDIESFLEEKLYTHIEIKSKIVEYFNLNKSPEEVYDATI